MWGAMAGIDISGRHDIQCLWVPQLNGAGSPAGKLALVDPAGQLAAGSCLSTLFRSERHPDPKDREHAEVRGDKSGWCVGRSDIHSVQL